jgi:3-deoxy-manno-octulosonate cytidylyltransferase (CMP-KDO synthetase)
MLIDILIFIQTHIYQIKILITILALFFFYRKRNSKSLYSLSFWRKIMVAIGIIPARYGSSRFPGKVLAPIAGISLLERTYKSARRAKKLSRLVIATDDDRVFEHAKGFGAEVYMTSQACANGSERLVDAIRHTPGLGKADIIINIQGDRPCVTAHSIDCLVDALEQHPDDLVATPVVTITDPAEVQNTASVKCVVDTSGYALYFSRAIIPWSKGKISYFKHIGLYAFRKDFLMRYAELEPTPLQQHEDLEQLKILEHGYKIRVVPIEYEMDLSVDYPKDIEKVETWLCKQNLSS